jgi:hypothetical protein
MSWGQAALDYRRRGFSVIPIKAKDKKPLITWDGYQKEPASEATVRHWADSWPNANVGIVTGAVSSCVVIDIDSDQARLNLKSLLGDYEIGDVPRTRTGKGWQLFFAHPGEIIPNRAGVLPGLDVRGDGGYVVAPPSIHPNGKQYKWEVTLNGELPALPSKLVELIHKQKTHENTFRERFDTAGALAGMPEGQRDQTLFKLACKLRNADVPREMAETLILESARNCEPPFPEKTALEKVARAYSKYRPKQSQADDRQEKIWPEPMSIKTFMARPMDKTRWLWDKTWAARGTSMMVGQPRDGKSYLVFNAALAISRGVTFLGRETVKAPVLYLSLDNSNEEMDEFISKLGISAEDQIFIQPGPIPDNPEPWLAEIVKRNDIKLVVIDTLQRFFHLEDSNAYAEAVNRMEPVDYLAKEVGFHVVYIHHSGKNHSWLGTTAFKAMCPTYMELRRVGDLQQRILTSDQRNGKNFESMAIGIDRHGWLEIAGTLEDAQINEAIPKIRDLLEVEDGATEPDIRKNMTGTRGIITSKAVRVMYKAGTIERTGAGRKGDPFKYHLAAIITDGHLIKGLMENPQDSLLPGGILKGGKGFSSYSIPSREKNDLGLAGLESKNATQAPEKKQENSSPEDLGLAGTRMGLESSIESSGTRIQDAKKEWEDVPR